MNSKVFLLSAFVLLFHYSSSAVKEEPKNCSKTEKFNITQIITEEIPDRKRKRPWCSMTPLQCADKWKTEIKKVNTTQVITKTNTILVCCPGYTETPDGTKCIPHCEEPCVHGDCTSPGMCTCFPHYDGPSCTNRACAEGKWGENCTESCNCFGSDSKCDIITGKCNCGIGRTGQRCETQCSSANYGRDCKEKCYCKNGGTCDPMNGYCSCKPGWDGVHCELPCPEGTYGLYCEFSCQCPNTENTRCDPATGNCTCAAGWHGESCTDPCPLGRYGVNCELSCGCKNNATCDTVNGKCQCKPGFSGRRCEAQFLLVAPKSVPSIGIQLFFSNLFMAVCSFLVFFFSHSKLLHFST